MDQCFTIDHSGSILGRQAVRLTINRDEGIQEKTRYQRLSEVKECLWGRRQNCTRHHRKCTLYIFSQCKSLKTKLWLHQLQRDLWSCEVRCFHLWPIWKSSVESERRYTMQVPEVCHAAHNLNLVINITAGKNGRRLKLRPCAWEEKEKKKDCVRCISICAWNRHTLLCTPWHHFPPHDQLVCCNIPLWF